MFSLLGHFFTALLSGHLVSCRPGVCRRVSWKLRQIPDKVMLVVGLVGRWNWRGSFLCFYWPTGKTVASLQPSCHRGSWEPSLGESLNASPYAWQLFSSRQPECSQADFISCSYSAQPLSPLAHTAPWSPPCSQRMFWWAPACFTSHPVRAQLWGCLSCSHWISHPRVPVHLHSQ